MNDALSSAISTTPIVIPRSAKSLRRRREIIGISDAAATSNRPIRAEARSKLLQHIPQALGWVEAMMDGRFADIETIAAKEAISLRAARMTLSLAFLAPDIVTAAAEGILPRGFGVSRLIDLPMRWEAQRRAIGLASTTSKH